MSSRKSKDISAAIVGKEVAPPPISAIGIRIFVPLNTKLKVKQTEKSNHVQSILPGERKQTEMCAQNRLSQGAEYWGKYDFYSSVKEI